MYTAPTPVIPATPAIVSITVSQNTYGTDPLLYYNVWLGSATDKQISTQLNTVISYFTGLGYTITPQTNTATGNSLQWKVCW